MKKETTGTSSPASKKPGKGTPTAEKKQKPRKKAPSRGGPRENSGGARDHSGRKTKAERLQALGVSDTIEAHLVQEVELTDGATPKLPEDHKPIVSKKPRLVAILDMLAGEALGPSRSVSAASEYLNRTLGRAKQTVEVSGSIKADDQAPPTPAEVAAAKAYEDALEDEDNDG